MKKTNIDIIAGPCSAESEEQLMEIALQLKNDGRVSIFRAGVWKPRTRPDMFEGIGEKALVWLNNIQTKLQLPCCVEVANKFHVEQCLKNNITNFWIGARTTVNPFLVQEIADALKGNDVFIMIKNPITPDLKLWLGAVERFENCGIKKIACIHRGFFNYSNFEYRNNPFWGIPIQLKLIRPDIKIICDPSHISGNRYKIAEISQKAIDLEMDGLMIETHNNPNCAKSDAEQQITPDDLFILLNNLILREKGSIKHQLVNNYRLAIDQIDTQIIELFAQRVDLVKKIGQYKKDHKITILQAQRWNEVREKIISFSALKGIDKDFVNSYLEILHDYMINEQEKIIN